uniref:Uncharacterized protein n=1 Tax=Piliocolobus tephrosceles TaxID=591936 RepID=A0A8C9HDD4_9PRIM
MSFWKTLRILRLVIRELVYFSNLSMRLLSLSINIYSFSFPVLILRSIFRSSIVCLLILQAEASLFLFLSRHR